MCWRAPRKSRGEKLARELCKIFNLSGPIYFVHYVVRPETAAAQPKFAGFCEQVLAAGASEGQSSGGRLVGPAGFEPATTPL